MYTNKLSIKNFNISVLLKKDRMYIYVYNKNFYCFFKILKSFNLRLKNSSYLELDNYFNSNFININNYLKQFYLCQFTKIKFTGKGYKIKKNTKKSIVLLFNRAHITVLWWNNLIIKRLKKYKMYIKYIQGDIIKQIINIRCINVFTRKGLRESRQVLFKKKGKK